MQTLKLTKKYDRYPKYKDSGVQWIGKIPQEWDTDKLRHIVDIKKRIAGVVGRDVLSITQRGIKVKNLENNDGQISGDYSKYQIIEKGDFAMNHMDLLTGYVDISLYAGVISPDYRVFTLRSERNCDKYLLYLFQLGYKRKIFYAYGQGAAQFGRWRMPASEFKGFTIPLPSGAEQRKIAAYLDEKTATIDRIIEKKKKQIELLHEKRTAIINHAVTKGLDPKANLVDSGIQWIGKIPKNWELQKIKHLAEIILGKMLQSDSVDGYVLRLYLRAQNVKWEKVDIEDVSSMWFSPIELKKYRLHKDDLLVSEGGEVGRTAIWSGELEECYFQNSINLLRVKKGADARYLMYMFEAAGKSGALDRIVNRISIAHLTRDKLKEVALPYTEDANEQKLIVKCLDQKLSALDTLALKIDSSITTLQEFKSSLISHVVTGKIKV